MCDQHVSKQTRSRSLLSKIRSRARLPIEWAHASSASRAVRRDRLTYCSYRKLTRIEQCVDRAMTREVPGVIVEFGVALGGSGIIMARRSPERQYHGFDVFGMIPPPGSEKDDQQSRDRYETIASGRSSGIGGDLYYGYRKDLFTDVVNGFARHGCAVDYQRVFLYKGLFEETWPRFPSDAKIAVAHVDCDWYDPVSFCIRAVLPRLSTGSSLVFDDYNDYGGARIAIDELLAEHGDQFSVDPGQNVVLTRL
jgi:O-methyltransferase